MERGQTQTGGHREWIPSGVSDEGRQLLHLCEGFLCVCTCECAEKVQKSSIKLKSRLPSEAVKSLGQMDAFQIIHEALRAPRRQTLTASLASRPFKLEAGSPSQTIFPVAGQDRRETLIFLRNCVY